jgi:hypothetical protein
VRRNDRLSGGQIALWTGLGIGAGIVAGIAVSEWVGEVNRERLGRVAQRLRGATPQRLTSSASVQAVEVALRAEPRLAGLDLQALGIRRGCVELRGWVPTRTARAIAGRVALGAPGIESIINSILVRGEDDRAADREGHATDQSA